MTTTSNLPEGKAPPPEQVGEHTIETSYTEVLPLPPTDSDEDAQGQVESRDEPEEDFPLWDEFVSATPEPPRARQLVTYATVSFSLTMLAGSLGVIYGIVPVGAMSAPARVDLGAMLLFAPVCALILGLLFEVARLALKAPIDDPEPRAIPIDWAPGPREADRA